MLKGFTIYADYYFITQFTQKYRNIQAGVYNHQFALGNGLTMDIAYDFTVKKARFSTSIEYGFASRTGEVTNVGKHKYDNSYVGFQLGFKF